MTVIKTLPNNEIETQYANQNLVVCGMDEVGRGAWAGPLVLACVIPGEGTIDGVNDSKKISAKKRDSLDSQIRSWAKGIGIGSVTNIEIDEMGLSKAITLASKRALLELEQVSVRPDCILLDGHHDFIKDERYKVHTIVKGDRVSHAIAAASIVAKVFRDNYMSSSEIAGKYAGFCFDKNKGYPAPVHRRELVQSGPTPLHRRSWNIFGDSFSETQANPLF